MNNWTGITEEKAHENLKEAISINISSYYPDLSNTVLTRINHELAVINSKKLSAEFLFFSDLVQTINSLNIRMSLGCGSAPSSIICYLLGITNVDPIYHELWFERFCNPLRDSNPDMVLEVETGRRNDIFYEIIDMYGKDQATLLYRDQGNGYQEPYIALNGVLDEAISIQLVECDSLKHSSIDNNHTLSLSNCIMILSKKNTEIFKNSILNLDIYFSATRNLFTIDSFKDLVILIALKANDNIDMLKAISQKRTLNKIKDETLHYLTAREWRPVRHLPNWYIDTMISVVGETQNFIIYQEQIIKIFHDIYGLSGGEADLARRVLISKHGNAFNTLELKCRAHVKAKQLSMDEHESLFYTMQNSASQTYLKSHFIGKALTSMVITSNK